MATLFQELCEKLKAIRDAVPGMTNESILADINKNYLPEGDPVSHSTLCNWMSGRSKESTTTNTMAIQRWLQNNKQN